MHQQTITTNKKCTNTTLTLIYNLMQYNHRIKKKTDRRVTQVVDFDVFVSPHIS